jgi:hypothetical protein
MKCTLSPASVPIRLECTRTIRAFEYTAGNNFYKDGTHTDTIRIEWDAKTMELVSYSYEKNYEDGSVSSSTVNGGRLISTDANGTQAVALAKNALVEFEWAWHAALLKADAGQSFSVPYATLMTWDNKLNKSTPVVKDAVMRVYGDEMLELLQGDLTVRKLTLAGQSAWYAREDAQAGIPRPTKFDDGMFVYTLMK